MCLLQFLAPICLVAAQVQAPRPNTDRVFPTPAAKAQESGRSDAEELNRALRLARKPEVLPETVIQAILNVGPGMLAPALLVLEERTLPEIDGGRALVLSVPQESLLLGALERWNAGQVWGAASVHLAVLEDVQPSAAARAAAILAAGTCVRSSNLSEMIAMSDSRGAEELPSEIERALQIACITAFRRDPAGFASWAINWRALPPLVLPALVRGAGASGDARALPLLEQQLGLGGDVARIALAELARQQAPRELPAQLTGKLRALLNSEQSHMAPSACAALAALGDFDSVGELVGLLQRAPSGLRASAHRALCKLSGLQLPDQYSSWHAWQKQQSNWYAERVDGLGIELLDGSELMALDALREIGLYHWERHKLSDLVASALWREEPSVVALACEILLRLDSPRAQVFLAEAAGTLDGPAAESAKRARASLVSR